MQLVCKYMQLTESAAVSETWEILTNHRSRRAVVCEKTEEPETKQLWIHFLKSQEQLYLGSTKWHLHQENAVLKKQREHEQRKLSSGNIIMRGEERERETYLTETVYWYSGSLTQKLHTHMSKNQMSRCGSGAFLSGHNEVPYNRISTEDKGRCKLTSPGYNSTKCLMNMSTYWQKQQI